MANYIGRIEVPEIVASGSFPLRTDYPHGMAIGRTMVTHTFANGVEQRFYVGTPATRYSFTRKTLTRAQRAALAAFWQSTQGCVGAFSYDVPQEDGTFVATTVRFEDAPLSLEDLTDAITSVGLTFVEIPDPAAAPSYAISGTVTRFPDATLNSALLDEVQEIIPLVRMRVSEAAVPDIFLSDRLVTVGEQVYLPRLLRVGEPGGDMLVQQSIDGSSDDVQFAFGNADRVMIDLANDTDLMNAWIELSLFHVGSGRKLDLWAGLILDWSSDQGPEFAVRASDRLSALTISSPVGTCSRSCWRRYGKDGCPATPGAQALDLVHFPAANASACDLGYETENGCLAHSGGANPTKHYFGGIWAKPQRVKILDNSTGHWGMGRQGITPTSQINDTLMGRTLPEIYHDDDGVPQRALPVACRIAAGREESDFYCALGVVGKGPLGAFAAPTMVDTDGDGKRETMVAHTLDGQPHHGFTTDDNGNPTDSGLGLRGFLGNDPADANAYFSLSRVGTTPSSWREVPGGGSVCEDTYAAGAAFLEIRRVDEKGIQLTAISSHSMQAMISKGLTAKTWTAPGSRVDAPGCTNVFWVAVNTFLRAIGLADADAAAQEAAFDVAAAIASAATADTMVSSIYGGGAEKQFRFKGTIDASKPTRDWLRDILNNGLGYFTWSFGRLRVGCRNTATATSTFRAGNMLLGSLHLEPLKPGFEKLTVEFADEEYIFARNTVSYVDQDYAAKYGRVANPRESQLGLVGSSTKSQSMRIAVCRAREELGGVGDAEQKAARNATWRSTILALDVDAGAVVSVAHSELSGNSGLFRVQSWRLNRDWSVDLVGKTVRASMYDLTAGAVPAAVSEAVQPVAASRDSGPPPTPTFSVRASTVDPASLEIYDLGFAQTTNTRTITSATFTISITGETDRVVTVNFPPDFFASTDAASWSLKVSLPGKAVTNVAGFVSNTFGNSASYSVGTAITLALSAISGGATVTGDAAVFDANGKIVDAGKPPVLSQLLAMGFLVGWNGGASVGVDIAGHRYISKSCAPVSLHVGCKTAPLLGDQSIWIYRVRTGVATLITSEVLVVAAGTTVASTTVFAAAMTLAEGDYLRIDISQPEGTPAAGVFVELLCREN